MKCHPWERPVIGPDAVVFKKEKAENNQTSHSCYLSECENELYPLCALNALRINERKQEYSADAQQLRGRYSEATGTRIQDITIAEGRNEIAGKLGEAHTHSGNSTRLYHSKERPAIEESPQLAECLAQVYVLAACLGEHTAQFAIAKGGSQRDEAGKRPHHYEPARAAQLAGNIRADDEYTRADHGANNEQSAIEQGERTLKR